MDARLQADPRKFEHRQPRCGDVWGPGSPFPNAGTTSTLEIRQKVLGATWLHFSSDFATADDGFCIFFFGDFAVATNDSFVNKRPWTPIGRSD